MPKIIIREYDKTKANTGEYQNFSVVVPGFVSDTCDQNVFDENGIFECSSQKTFEEKIGDYYTSLTTDKRFIMLEDGCWDLRSRHTSDKLAKIEDEEFEENSISLVFQMGFKIGDKIIRHAMVQVANCD